MEETEMENEGDGHRDKDSNRGLIAHCHESHTKVLRTYPKSKVKPQNDFAVSSDIRITMSTLCTTNWKKAKGDVKKPVKELEWSAK